MKTPPSDPDSRWEKLVRQARADLGPPTDLPALLRAVRNAPVVRRNGWAAEFIALFAFGRAFPTCLAGAAAFALLASWQAWDSWQALPWAQLLTTAAGGSP